MRILMVLTLLLFPSLALADIVIMGDVAGMRSSPAGRAGVTAGLGIAADSWKLGPIKAGPDFRVGSGRTTSDAFTHGGLGAHLTLDFLLRASLAFRVGAGHFEGSLPGGHIGAGRPHEGVAPLTESDLTISLPLGPALAGIRFGHGRLHIANREDYAWSTVGAAFGLRF